jgi:antitoxin PrlF
MVEVVVSVTKKGQATIPKKMRRKYGIKDKVVLIDEDEKGILLKPLPSPYDEIGSLKGYFEGKTAREILTEYRKEEFEAEKKRFRNA